MTYQKHWCKSERQSRVPSGPPFNYLISVVTLDNNFTEEFQEEIRDLVPSLSEIMYDEVVTLVGIKNIDSTLLYVAGSDGFNVA